MGFLDSVTERDLSVLDTPTFTPNEPTEFVVRRVTENSKQGLDGVQRTSIGLHCDVLTGQNEGRKHSIYLSEGKTLSGKENYLKALVALYGREPIAKKTAKLSDLVGLRVRAVPGKVSIVGEKEYQNWFRWEKIGKVENTNSSVPF